MPSLAAKNARTCEIKCLSSGFSSSQCPRSFDRSTSSAVQNDASAFLYICQISLYLMGNTTKRRGFSLRRGSLSCSLRRASAAFFAWKIMYKIYEIIYTGIKSMRCNEPISENSGTQEAANCEGVGRFYFLGKLGSLQIMRGNRSDWHKSTLQPHKRILYIAI